MFKNKKGFSLVELIVVIAILAVLVAVLAPSLIRYTEDSRAQKDISAMDELVNAVQLSLANDKCFDEALEYSIDNNFITYTDSSAEYGTQMADEEFYAPDGAGKATTITFNPETREDGKTIYRLQNALVNDMTYGNGSVAKERTMEGAKIDNNQCYFSDMELLYNAVRLTVGDTLTPTSTTYRNSSFTVFITFSQKDGVTVAEVDGAFNGTNLHDGCQAASGSGETGAVDAEYSNTNFSNSSIDIPSYKHDTYVENVQKDNLCEYYSSVALAAKDVSDNTIGINSDADKNNAAACVYIDKQGIPTVVVLKDNVETEKAVFTCHVNIILGGHTLTYYGSMGETSNVCLDLYDGGLIDGSIAGSRIVITPPRNTTKWVQPIQVSGDITINGGEYIAESDIQGCVILVARPMEGSENNVVIKNITAKAKLYYNANNEANGSHFYHGISNRSDSTDKILIENCEIYVQGYGDSDVYGLGLFSGNTTVKNTKINVESEGSIKKAIGVSSSKQAIINVVNCVINSSGYAAYSNTNGNITITGTKTTGQLFGIN